MKFSDEVLTKAHRLLETDRLRRDRDYANIWWVLSSDGAAQYRVQSDYNPETGERSWITCTCPHGLNAGAGDTRCYHAAAALLMMVRANVGMAVARADAEAD